MNDIIHRRRSVRKFLDKPIEDEKVNELLNAGMFAPSGMNIKGYEFVVVKDKETLTKLSKIGKWVDFVANCNVAIVLVTKEYTFWVEDCALVAENILLEAVNQGLAGCWADVKDGQVLDGTDREPLVREILGIPNNLHVMCMLAIGYAITSPKPHDIMKVDNSKIHLEKY